MADIYVKQTGSDTTGDGTAGNPYKTINKAHDVASGGDTIIVDGTLTGQDQVALSRSFSSGAKLTIAPHPTNGALIDGEFIYPAYVSGQPLLTNPENGDISHYKALIDISGSWIVWKVDVQESLGRGIGISGSNIEIADCTVNLSRNAGVNASGATNVTYNNVTVERSGCFYRKIRNPSEVNWPVAFNNVACTNVVATGCTTRLNWGEGFSAGRGSSGVTFQDGFAYDNMALQIYNNRAQHVYLLRNTVYFTGTVPDIVPADGIVLRNEDNTGTWPAVDDVDIAHNLVVGCKNNIMLAGNQDTGDVQTNVRVRFNTSVKASTNGLFVAGADHDGFTIEKNTFWQPSGAAKFASASNVAPATHTFATNAWVGGATAPVAAVTSGSDINSVVLAAPNAAYGQGTLDPDNYRTTTASVVGSETGIGTTDLVGTTRAGWTIGALEYGDESPPPPPTGGSFELDIARVACNTSAGDQTITLSGLSTAPNLILPLAGYATADNTAADHAVFSKGAATAAAQWAIAFRDEHNVNPSDSSRHSVSDACILLVSPVDGSVIGKASIVSFSQTQVVINWSVAPPSGYFLIVTAIVAPSVWVGIPAVNITANASTTVTPGFEAEVVIADSNFRSIPSEAGNADWLYSTGLANVVEGTITQKSLGVFSDDAASPTVAAERISTDRILVNTSSAGGITYAIEMAEVTSVDFKLYTRNGTPGTAANMGLVVLGLGGREHYVGVQQTPASAVTPPDTPVDLAWTGYGFKPMFSHLITTLLSALDTGVTATDVAAFGFSFIRASESQSMAWAMEDAQTTSDTQAIADDQAINMPLPDGAAGVEATHGSFDSDGQTLSVIRTPATARYVLVLAIREGTSVTAEFDGTPTSGASPLEVDFDASDSTASGTTIDEYEWDWGDGSAPEITGSPTISHTYTVTEEGTVLFTVGLTVRGTGGEEGYKARVNYISVTYTPPAPPTTPTETLLVALAGSPATMKPNGLPAAGGSNG